ncbi:ATP-binding protein, partial [bacterium]|nr:ATP-binding protein [bacterium]
EGKRGYCRFERLAFADDGKGMDEETLANCMTIGWSSRYNSRDGIGRFGVGMTMAAIHECKRVEVYSKSKGGEWLYTFLDLDDIAAGEMDEIPAPSKKRVPNDLADLVPGESGTIIVWSKYDRQSDNASKLLEESRTWIGRTYRYFMWDQNVSIKIDGEEVKAIDPLYVRLENTAFPNDTPGTGYQKMDFDWPVDVFDAPDHAPKESTVSIKLSLLPEELRQIKGGGGNDAVLQRKIDQNEGISILRNGREVFYGHIPYWKAAGPGWPHFEEIDRWWGCEIHFDAVLDRAFEVKNIKRGAVPSKQLKQQIKELIQPTRDTCLEEVRKIWAANGLKKKEEQAQKEDKAKRTGDHERAEQVVKRTPTDSNVIDEGKDFEKEANELIKKLGDQYDDEQKAALKGIFSTQPFSIMEHTWAGPQFFESHHLGGKSVLDFNMRHTFFEIVYGIIADLEDEGDPYVAAKGLKDLLDLLIIAYAKAETRFAKDEEMDAESFLEMLRSNWGQYLMSYVKTWNKSRKED